MLTSSMKGPITIPTLEIVSPAFRTPYALYHVPVDGRTVYMAAHRTSYINDERAVVIVDAEKFLELWQADPMAGGHPFGNPETWRKDYKFLGTEEKFSKGYDNPVSLANVVCRMDTQIVRPSMKFLGVIPVSGEPIRCSKPCVGFNNGITRTIWLLANGCKSFPVECRLPSAHLLYGLAAAPGTKLCTVEELTGAALARAFERDFGGQTDS